jgi:hypothetical protein
VGESYLDARLDVLRRTQNPDGGWGYFPGKQSWLEPTAYAALATGSESAVRCLKSWQLPGGGFRPSSQVRDATWVTALAVLAGNSSGVRWLLATSGRESRWTVRLFSYFGLLKSGVNVNHRGWPWRPQTSAWVEPTALAVLALKKTASARSNPRIQEGQEWILSRRDRDGGWNCGNPNVLNYDSPSYPETTALALIGLQGRDRRELAGPIEVARTYYQGCKSPLAKAWLTIALRCHGHVLPPPGDSPPPRDTLICTLEALGHPAGNWKAFQV